MQGVYMHSDQNVWKFFLCKIALKVLPHTQAVLNIESYIRAGCSPTQAAFPHPSSLCGQFLDVRV